MFEKRLISPVVADVGLRFAGSYPRLTKQKKKKEGKNIIADQLEIRDFPPECDTS
jgi:hypothetical protein